MPDRLPGRVGLPKRLVVVAVALLGAIALVPPSVAATTVVTQPDATVVDTTERDPSPVDTTEVDTTEETTPADSADTTIGSGDGLVGANPDPDTGDVALMAIVGLVVVLSLAAWWMVRRDDERPVPDPPPPSGDLL